jgi:hypothetical protein
MLFSHSVILLLGVVNPLTLKSLWQPSWIFPHSKLNISLKLHK